MGPGYKCPECTDRLRTVMPQRAAGDLRRCERHISRTHAAPERDVILMAPAVEG
ncbi:toxin RelE [Anopheles sinensis]|uniref:Toxin RelE n=1 Tax=Anopheles sinensis TaxID=74873 RepID=A0A084VYT8_ANOSI|nr:toxin RelE [Anopheles sinensis]